jgi:hypothetical protein
LTVALQARVLRQIEQLHLLVPFEKSMLTSKRTAPQ